MYSLKKILSKNPESEINLTNFTPDLLGKIVCELPYEGIMNLAATNKNFNQSINEKILKNPDVLLTLSRRAIQHYFGSTINFAAFYDKNQHNELRKLDLQDFYKAIIIVGKKLTPYYEKAFDVIQQLFLYKFIEAYFVIAQLLRSATKIDSTKIKGTMIPGFQYASFFQEKNSDLLNSLTLAHFYYLLNIDHKRLDPWQRKVIPTLPPKLSPNLHQAISDLVNTYIAPQPPRIIPYDLLELSQNLTSTTPSLKIGSGQLDLDALNKLPDNFKSKMQELILLALESIDSSLKAEFEKIPQDMQLQYVISLCTPGANLLIEQLLKYSLINGLFKLSPLQIQAFCNTNISWLFDKYQGKILEQIENLSSAQSLYNKKRALDLSFLNKKEVKNYFKTHEKQLPNLDKAWGIKPLLCNPEFRELRDFQKLENGGRDESLKKMAYRLNEVDNDKEKKEIFSLF